MASARACSIPPSKLAIAAFRPFAFEREVTAGTSAESKITIIPRTTSISINVKARKRPRRAGANAKAGANCFREQVFAAESACSCSISTASGISMRAEQPGLNDSFEVISYTAGEDEQSNGGGVMGGGPRDGRQSWQNGATKSS